MPNYEQPQQLFQAFHHRSLEFGLLNSSPNLTDAEYVFLFIRVGCMRRWKRSSWFCNLPYSMVASSFISSDEPTVDFLRGCLRNGLLWGVLTLSGFLSLTRHRSNRYNTISFV